MHCVLVALYTLRLSVRLQVGLQWPDLGTNSQFGTIHQGSVYTLSWTANKLLSCGHDGKLLQSPIPSEKNTDDAAKRENIGAQVALMQQRVDEWVCG